MNARKKLALTSTAAVFFISIALLCLVVLLLLERIVDAKISEAIKLQNNSMAFMNWKGKSSPSKFVAYLYNLTNPDRVLSGEKPNLAVVGPYVYWKNDEKLNISWTNVDNLPAISYLKRSIYIFDPNLSSGNPKLDKIISANLPILAISSASNAGRGPSLPTIEMIKFLSTPKVFIKQSVDDFLWGYQDTTLGLCKLFFPDLCQTDRVGLLSNSNDTLKGPYVIDSGINNSTNTGNFITINGKRSLHIWSSEKANSFHWTDGFRLVRGIQLSDSRQVFVPLLCQPIKLNATSFSRPSVFDQLEVVEMELDVESRTNEETYCPLKTSGPVCPPKGYFDISQCAVSGTYSPPVFASLPDHMDNDTDDYFIIRRVSPISRDKFRLLVEPKTGIVVEAHIRLQINVHIQRSPHMTDFFKNISNPIYLPMAWFENDIEGSREDLQNLYEALSVSPRRMRLILVFLLVVCLLVFVPLMADLAMTIKAFKRKWFHCCSRPQKPKPSNRNLLLEPPTDSSSDSFTSNSCNLNSPVDPWSISQQNRWKNQLDSETGSECQSS